MIAIVKDALYPGGPDRDEKNVMCDSKKGFVAEMSKIWDLAEKEGTNDFVRITMKQEIELKEAEK